MGDLGLRLVLVSAGGALGAASRYLITVAAAALFGGIFPLGTLIVNVLGCLAAGIVLAIASADPAFSPNLRLLIMTGFLGGLTTFSAFSVETLTMAQQEQWGRAALNIVASLVLSLGSVWAGWVLVRSLQA